LLISKYTFGAVLLVICGSGIFVAKTLVGQIRERANDSALETATVFSSLSVQRTVDWSDFVGTSEVSATERSDLDADLAALRGRHRLAGLEIWDGRGRLLYADKHHPVKEQTLPQADADRAALGEPWVSSTVNVGERGVRTVDVFVPYQAQAGAPPYGLMKLLIPEAEISGPVAGTTHRLLVIFGVALALVVGALVWLRRGVLRREHRARHDKLTGLMNRDAFRDRLRSISRSSRGDFSNAVLVLGIDRFRTVNDSLGHAAGDLLLEQVGSQIRTWARHSDAVARLGGDQFAVLLTQLADDRAAETMARRLLDRLRAGSFRVEGVEVSVEVGIGVAPIPYGANADSLLRRADIAMYRAKRSGAGVVSYDEADDTGDVSQLALLVELRRAIDNDELRLHYQPKAALVNGEVNSVEALVRWQHPTRGFLFPSDFIPVAEHTGLMKPLTEWVLEHAINQAACWHRTGLSLAVAVNISPRSLLETALPTTVQRLLADAELPSRLLEIEVTETAVMADPVAATRILTQLHALGIRLSIDDFGAGYTSLAYLKSLPVDILKIDRVFISEICDSAGSAAITQAIIGLGHRLGFTVVAEGIETERTWELLRDYDCDEGQGFLLARPMTADHFDIWFNARRTLTPA
jgi:diguanylate cyclase (GGDEF)-like protein